MDTESAIFLLIFGAAGALVKELVDDNAVDLPRFKSGKLYLGILGAMIVGAAVGYIIDNSPVTAFLSGFAGIYSIQKLLPTNTKTVTNENDAVSLDTANK